MKRLNVVRACLMWVTVSVVPGVQLALAHHSFPATYQVDQTVTIEGTVTQFMFRNPHSFVHVMAMGPDGTAMTWSVEWGAGNGLGDVFKGHEPLKPGDKVTVVGNPARDTTQHRLRMRSIVRPADGWKWEGTFG